jgi:hypothetical protein
MLDEAVGHAQADDAGLGARSLGGEFQDRRAETTAEKMVFHGHQ